MKALFLVTSFLALSWCMKRAAQDNLGPERNVRRRIGPLVEGLLEVCNEGAFNSSENTFGLIELIGAAFEEEVYTPEHVCALVTLCESVENVWKDEKTFSRAHRREFLSRLGSYLAKAPVPAKNPAWQKFMDEIAQPLLDNVKPKSSPTHAEMVLAQTEGLDIITKLPFILEKASEEPELTDEGIWAIGELLKVARQYLALAAVPIIRQPILNSLRKFVTAHGSNPIEALIHRTTMFLSDEDKAVMVYGDATYADLKDAVIKGDEMLAVNIIKNCSVEFLTEDCELVRMAVAKGMTMLYTIFMEDSRFQPGMGQNELICLAADNKHWDLVELMLKDVRFDPRDFDYKVMFHALNNNIVPLMKMLLMDGRMEAVRRDIEVLSFKRGFHDIHLMALYLGEFKALGKAIDKAIAHEDMEMIHKLIDLANADITMILGTAQFFENDTAIKLILSSERIPFSSYSETLEYILPDHMATRIPLFKAVKDEDYAALDAWLHGSGEHDPEYLQWAIYTCIHNFKGALLNLILKKMALFDTIMDDRFFVLVRIQEAFEMRAPHRHFYNHIDDAVIAEIATWLYNSLNSTKSDD